MKNLNLKLQSKKLYALTGDIGSGKSSILSCIIGDFPIYSGKMKAYGKINYSEQDPIIFNATIKENVLMGREWD